MSRMRKLKGLTAASLRLKTLNDNPYLTYLYRDKVELRKGISGLSGIVRSEIKMNLTLMEI